MLWDTLRIETNKVNNKNNEITTLTTGRESTNERVYSFQYLAIIPLSENTNDKYS